MNTRETIEREIKIIARTIFKCLFKEQGKREENTNEHFIANVLFVPKYAEFDPTLNKFCATSHMLKKSFNELKKELRVHNFLCKYTITHYTHTHYYQIIISKGDVELCRIFYKITPLHGNNDVYTDFKINFQYVYSMYDGIFIDTVVSYDEFLDIAAGIKNY